MDEANLFSQEEIDKFRRTRKPKDIVRTKALLERDPIEPKRMNTLIDIGNRVRMEQNKAEKIYEDKLYEIRKKGIELARQYKLADAKKIKKEDKIMRPTDVIGIGKTGGMEDKTEIKNKHLHYAKKYKIPFEENGLRRTYDDLLKAIRRYEEANIYHIMKAGHDKKTGELGMFIQ
jgi:hypothetical protein